MTTKALLARIKFTKDDFDKIKLAVEEAEKHTSGEIALAITAESSSYAFWELLFSSVTSFLLALCLLPLSPHLLKWIEYISWGETKNASIYLIAFFLFCVAAIITVFYFLYNIPFFDRMVIPKEAREAAVSRFAIRHFAQSGVYATDNHNGILIFVSYFEREVRIVADKAIAGVISQDLWNLIADEMAENIGSKGMLDAFLCAIERCGSLLRENFPSDGSDRNELSDSLVILENEQWA